ncbi:3-oxoacyl-[acyl-carrier-protein] synthase 2 [Streptomyces sp. RB5]|uniref:3-oxoacyl-[acyl-carrier-protein] synthase 2 n=1 Tax=Streptomyces smaragdinus TaxID=2585196 RepID=A0A7K0CPH6_9ACTN|nr:beta-ketoacyl-[acyl-carrier-protein] synthase family protein [Streptomyces smaragdinus]MQY15213.1 3-oxoacyl-[acyl-carrier-protein] synthase 2 [Streptomyces smaragdinus]
MRAAATRTPVRRRQAPPPARKVVLTGCGVLSSIGIGVESFTDGLRAGRVGTGDITAFDTTGFPSRRGHQVHGFEPSERLHRIRRRDTGRATQFAAAAARMALEDSGLSEAWLRDRRGIVVVGTTDGETGELDLLTESVLAAGIAVFTGGLLGRTATGSLALGVARELDVSNVETSTIATACAAGNYAIGSGFDAVRSGEAEWAIVGGADALNRKTFAGFSRLGLIAADECRPFDTERAGLLTGEGAGMLLLETEESALARGAHIYAEVLGYGLNCDAAHPTAPEADSVARCIRLALTNASVKPEEVDLISAHGTGTVTNDNTEIAAIRQVYGRTPPRTVGIKGMIGHTMGAASALGAIASALAIRYGFVPPTANHRTTDPNCEVDVVPNESVPAKVRVVQNNGLAFGGNNAVLLLGHHPSTQGEHVR